MAINYEPTVKPQTVASIFTKHIAKVIPLAFDESMSYYECICAFRDYLNTVIIPNVNNVNDGLAELQQIFLDLQTAVNTEIERFENTVTNEINDFETEMNSNFNTLQDFINNYFDNLDVQDEINNKLDKMAQDGTFDEIINQELFSELNTKINNSLILNEYEDNTSINNKFKNINITLHNYNDTTLYDIELLNIDEIKLLPTGGSKSNPELNTMNILTFSKTNTNYDLYINGGVFSDSTHDTWGYCIFDGIPYDGGFGTPDYYVGLDENNNILATNSNEIDNIDQLVSLGYKNCCGTFAPFIINGQPTDISNYNDETYTIKQPRQIIYQKNDNSFHILSIIGRNPFNQGLTYTDVQNYLSTKNVKIAINLDGGGSVQSVYKKRKLFETQDSNLKDGRSVTNAFVIKIGGEF